MRGKLYMLPADPFDWPKSHRRRNGTRDEHKHLDQIYEKQMCSYSLKEHLISLKFF